MDIIIIDSSSSSEDEQESTPNHDRHDHDLKFVTTTSSSTNHHQEEKHQKSTNDDDDDDGDDWDVVPTCRIKTKKHKMSKPGININTMITTTITTTMTNTTISSFMIMLIGIPGSGKSHLAQMLVTIYPQTFIRISQDVLKSRIQCEIACRQAILSGRVPIIDRCNINPKQRQSFLRIASECNIPVDGILFQYSQEECILRCEERGFHETLDRRDARRVVGYMAKDFDPPNKETDGHMFRSMNNVSSFHQANAIISKYTS
jgi:predicted kinase